MELAYCARREEKVCSVAVGCDDSGVKSRFCSQPLAGRNQRVCLKTDRIGPRIHFGHERGLLERFHPHVLGLL